MRTTDQIIAAYKLTSEDYYFHKDGWKIITKAGIGKIKFTDSISCLKDVAFVSADGLTVIVKCSAFKGSIQYDAIGESAPQNSTWRYPASVAEKRAESRAVLEISDMYRDKWRGEEEIDETVIGQELLVKRKQSTEDAIASTSEKIEKVKSKPTLGYKRMFKVIALSNGKYESDVLLKSNLTKDEAQAFLSSIESGEVKMPLTIFGMELAIVPAKKSLYEADEPPSSGDPDYDGRSQGEIAEEQDRIQRELK